MASLYGAGAAIGFSPQQVDQMSIWQLNAVLVGYAKAHSPAKNRLSEGEKEELFDWLEAANPNARDLSTMTYRWDGERLGEAVRVSFRVGN